MTHVIEWESEVTRAPGEEKAIRFTIQTEDGPVALEMDVDKAIALSDHFMRASYGLWSDIDYTEGYVPICREGEEQVQKWLDEQVKFLSPFDYPDVQKREHLTRGR